MHTQKNMLISGLPGVGNVMSKPFTVDRQDPFRDSKYRVSVKSFEAFFGMLNLADQDARLIIIDKIWKINRIE